MKREIVIVKNVAKSIDNYIKKSKISQKDLDVFLKNLAEYPESGDVIPGTSGLRKIRLKSLSGGKWGGFRVCYFYLYLKECIYLLALYAKNDQEDITNEEKKILKEYVELLKRG